MVVLTVTALLWVFPLCLSYKLVDLSHPLSPATFYWPGMQTFDRLKEYGGTNQHNVWIEYGRFSSGEHGGTHIDAPRHFVRNGYDLKDLPLERTVAEGVMLDFSAEAAADMDYAVPVQKLEQWEEEHGRIPDEAAVLLNFGYSSKFSDPASFVNSNNTDDPMTFHFPFLSLDAARWLVEKRNMKIIGTDLPSPDAATDNTFMVHTLVLPRNIIILENVNIPKSLPPRDFRLYSSPIRVENGTGVQTRIFAMVYDKMNDGSAQSNCHCSWHFTVGLMLIATLVYTPVDVKAILLGGKEY